MLITLSRLILGRILWLLASFGRIKAVRLPEDEVVTADRLRRGNCEKLRSVLSDLDIPVVYERASDFGATFYVEGEPTDRFMRAVDRLRKDGFVAETHFFMKGARRKVHAKSRGLCYLTKWLIPRERIDEVAVYQSVRSTSRKLRHCREYASSVRFMVLEGEWWINRWSDIASSPVQRGHLDSLSKPAVNDITFPIDLVYTWVDGSDPAWCERKDGVLRSLGQYVPRRSANRSRWENRDELLYSLRSVALYVPWVRNIYIVTDRQIPDWLETGPGAKVRIIDHREVFPADAILPSFNSHAIESVLHRIEGLAEHFIYMNDDFFFGAPTTPHDFFSPGGLCKVFYSSSMMPVGAAQQREKASEWGGINASSLLERELGVLIRQKVRHTPIALRRSLLEELEVRFADAFRTVRSAPFRSADDISPLTALYVNYAVATGRAVDAGISYAYLDIGMPNARTRLKSYLAGSGRKVFCLNDTEEYEGGMSWEEKDELVRAFLGALYPWPSPWEKRSPARSLVANARAEGGAKLSVTMGDGR